MASVPTYAAQRFGSMKTMRDIILRIISIQRLPLPG
jgi:hypothetical protein